MNGMAGGVPMNIISVWPLTTSLSAAAPPLYGTCWMRVDAMLLRRTSATCEPVPFPDDAMLRLPGFALSRASMSLNDAMPDLADVMRSSGDRDT